MNSQCCSFDRGGQNISIYILKAVMAFSVVFLHVPSIAHVDYVIKPFSRIAVASFLMITGYFLYRENGVDAGKLRKRIVNILKLIFVSNAVYFLFNIFVSYLLHKEHLLPIGIDTPVFWLKWVFLGWNFSGPLWYLTGTFWALILILILQRFELVEKAFYIIPGLVIVGLLLNRYSFLMGVAIPVEWSRNAIVFCLPYILLGIFIKKNESRFESGRIFLFVLVFAALAYLELFILLLSGHNSGHSDFFIMGFPLAVSLFLLCLRYPDARHVPTRLRDALVNIGRNHSKNIYLYHSLVSGALYATLRIFSLPGKINCPIVVFVLALLLSATINFADYRFSTACRRKLK